MSLHASTESTQNVQSGALTRVDPLAPDWNQYLGHFGDATVFHTTEWARVLIDSYGYVPYYYKGQSQGRPFCVCLFNVDSWLTGKRAVSLPFADEAPALGIREAEELSRYVREIGELGRAKRWKRIEIRGAPLDWSGGSTATFLTHDLDLTAGAASLFNNCHDSTRRAVRKAERSGMVVEIRRDLEAVHHYYHLHCLTRKKHGVPPQPKYFFQNIHRHLIAPGFGFTALASYKGNALAGAVFCMFSGKAVYKFGASDPNADHLRPSNLVMWSGIKHLAMQGAHILNFGRTDLEHEGLRRYKLGWGTSEKTICYLQFDPLSATFLSKTSSSRSSHVLRILPLWVLKQIGAAIYPHLA